MIAERMEELAAGQLIRILIAAVRRSHLFEDVIATKRDVQPANPGEDRRRQKIFFYLAALQLFCRDADAFAEAQKQRAVAQYRPRRPFEVGITNLGMNDIDKFLMDLRIVDAGQLAAH